MGTQPSNDKKGTHSHGEGSGMSGTTVLTDAVSVGRTGREWHLPFEAQFNQAHLSERSSAIEISKNPDETKLIRATCEFLRDHAPAEYLVLHKLLSQFRPIHPVYREAHREARDKVQPASPHVATSQSDKLEDKNLPVRAPFTMLIPDIDAEHWAYKRHYNVGNYQTTKSGDRQTLSQQEATQDVGAMTYYLKKYNALAESVDGRKLWKATFEPGFRDPYYTCMELCVGEAQIPSHFLSLIHHGIALHMMYELSLPWKEKNIPKGVSPEFIDALRNAFEALARFYREDFCS